jgi:hypothetical protein
VATPEPKYLAARIVSSRSGHRSRRTVQILDYASLVPCALYWIWFRAGTDCAAEIDIHMLSSPSAVGSIGLGDRNWRSQNLALCSSYLVGLCRETVIAQLRLTNSERHANESLKTRRRDWTAAANLPAAQEETTDLGRPEPASHAQRALSPGSLVSIRIFCSGK